MSTIELRLKEDMEGPIIRMDKWYNDMDNEYNDYNESKHNTDTDKSWSGKVSANYILLVHEQHGYNTIGPLTI